MAADEQIPDTDAPDLTLLAQSDVQVKSDKWGIGGEMPWVLNLLEKGVLQTLGLLLRIPTRLASLLFKALQKVLDQDNPELGRLAVSVLGVMFGHELADTIPGTLLNPGNLEEVAPAIGAAVLRSVFGPLQFEGGGTLEPGVERAESYLGAITQLVTRGFMLDMLEEVVPHWHLEFIHNLEHEVIAGLGLGRVARQVLHPIVHALVAMPAEWAVNLSYRPKLHSPNEAVQLWELGELSDDELDQELGRQGWSAQRIEHLKELHLGVLDFTSAMLLVSHGVLTEDDVMNGLLHQGFLQTAAQHRIEAWHLARVDKWTDQLIAKWMQLAESRVISLDMLRTSLAATGRPADERQAMLDVVGAALEVPTKILSKDELFAAWENNIVTQNDVHDGLLRLGYAELDAETLLLTRLAVGQHRTEIEQQRLASQEARAAQREADKLARLDAQHEKAVEAAAAKSARAAQLAAERAQAKQDAESRRQFIAARAEARHAIVDAAAMAGQIEKDHAAALKAQLDASTRALLAQVSAAEADAAVAFERELLDLKVQDGQEALDRQEEEIQIALDVDAAARQQAVDVRRATVDALLALKLRDVDSVFVARAHTIDDDLAAALAAVDIAQLPTSEERIAAANTRLNELVQELSRKLTDLDVEYAERHQTVEDELSAKLITDKAAAREHDRLGNALAQAKRLATQLRDVSATRVWDAANAVEAMAAATAQNTKTDLDTRADAARRQLAADQLAAETAAEHDAAAERLRLDAVAALQAPMSAAAAAKKRETIARQLAALTAQKTRQQAIIQRAEDKAHAAAARAQAGVDAAEQHLQLVEQTAAAQEAAADAARKQLEHFDAETEQQRQELEAAIRGHQQATTSLLDAAATS